MKMFIFSLFLVISFMMFSPNIVLAQNEITVGSGTLDDILDAVDDIITESESTSGKSIMLTNPLAKGDVQDIPTLVKKLLEIFLKIGAPLIALAIIYSGYLFIAAQGNSEALKKAKSTLVYVIVGAAILLGAYVIAESIVGTVNAIRGT